MRLAVTHEAPIIRESGGSVAGAWDPRAATYCMTCQAERVLSGANDSRLHPKPGAAVTQNPARKTTKPVDQTQRGAASPSLDRRLAVPPGAPLTDEASADAPVPVGLRPTRICVLCGHPLRAGQRMLRIQGTTIHARCSTTS
jgi:hypothetical protein